MDITSYDYVDEELNKEEPDLEDDGEIFYENYNDFEITEVSSAGAWTSLILGIISTLSWMVPIVGLPITVVGLVLGAMNMRNPKAKGAAIAGFIVNTVFLCVTVAKGIVDLVMHIKHKKKIL